MKCPYCDESIINGAEKCKYCKEFIKKNIKEEKKTNVSKKETTQKSDREINLDRLNTVIITIVAVLAGGVASIFTRALFEEGYGEIVFLFIAAAVGFWFIGHFIGRYINNHKIQRVIEYCCFITWVFPPLGIINGGVVYNIARREQHRFFKSLSAICVGLAIINSLYGIALALSV